MRGLFAKSLNVLGNTANDRKQFKTAKVLYSVAARIDPKWSSPWYNLGLQAKYKCEWQASLRYNQKSAQLDPEDEASWWNLGIAATALRDWQEARRAWRRCGIEVPEGSGEIQSLDMSCCVRLNPHLDGEVVWGERLDPARALIQNVPLFESGHRYKDIILTDGAQEGTRVSKSGDEYPVFNELEIWKASSYSTFRSNILAPDEAVEQRLVTLCQENDIGIDDWSAIRILCSACSRGSPGPHNCADHDLDSGARRIGFGAIDRSHLLSVLELWRSEAGGRSYDEPTLELLASAST
jgi:tetratricopeptide (TPR) repeat protein